MLLVRMSDSANMRIECVHAAHLCYALVQGSHQVVNLLRIHNDGTAAVHAIEVHVSLSGGLAGELAAPCVMRVDTIAASAWHEFADVPLALRVDALANITERQVASLLIQVRSGDALLAREERSVALLAYNEWPGSSAPHALLASFVLPNHPAIAPVLSSAGARLMAATGSASLDAYQTRDPDRALAIVRAIYEAVLERGIVYVSPPASFESEGQKIRTPEQVLGDRLGTCLDLAVLIAAAIEQSGLHALVVIEEGHAICGAFLRDENFAEAAMADPLPLRKRVELGRAVLFECTTVCIGEAQAFGRAVELGAGSVHQDAAFVCVIDVTRARRQGIRPLASRTSAFQGDSEGAMAAVPADAVAMAPIDVGPVAARRDEQAVRDRLGEWQRRLLDLSLRNRLLNFVPTKRSVALQTSSLGDLVKALSSGAQFRVAPRAELPLVQAAKAEPTTLELDQAMAKLLRDELAQSRLHADLTKAELDPRLIELFRHARVGNEESGVNTLFLAAGFLRWYETPTSKEPRLAPLLLLPLRLERISIAEGFVLVLSDEEPRLNETLVQKLEQDFGVRLPELGELEGEDGVRTEAVVAAFRRAIVDIDRWEVEATAQVGIFSFAKFLMWADLKERRDLVLQHEFLRHLIETPNRVFAHDGSPWPTPAAIDAKPPHELLCPMDADSSQLCAVIAAADGRSFVLEGPPGTGKSQTITNLIAQSLADGKRVLFVAEKRAALEVVQRRLKSVGLAPFCLELHADKGQKRTVVEQLGRTLEITEQCEPHQWQEKATALQAVRDELNGLVAAVHRVRGAGFSAFDAAARAVAKCEFAKVEGLRLDVDAAGLQRRRDAIAALAAAADKLGGLRAHPWFGVQRTDWSPSLASAATALGQVVTAAIEPARAAYEVAARTLALPPGPASGGREELDTLARVMGLLATGPLPLLLCSSQDFAAAHSRALHCVELGDSAARAAAALAGEWRPEFLALDHAALMVAILRNEHAFALLRWWRLRAVKEQLRAVCLCELPDLASVRVALDHAVSVLDLRRQLAAVDAEAKAAFGDSWQGAASDFTALRASCARASAVHAATRGLVADDTDLARVRAACVAAAGNSGARAAMQQGAAAHEALRSALMALQAPLQLCFDRAFGTVAEKGFLDAVAARLASFQGKASELRDQCAFQRDAVVVRELGDAAMVDALELDRVTATATLTLFECSFAHSWLEREVQRDPVLQRFRSEDHERRIAKFRALDREWIEVGGELVRARLAAKLPRLRATNAGTSELGILLRELKKQRRHLPARQLFAAIPTLLPLLAPCLLMSPMTVAQVLGRRLQPFDIVVFDEASQVPMWDAVGAISRGRSLVVVGDEKQLPPTSFFARMEDDLDAPTDGDSIDELESVLDECHAAGMNKLYLRWHYRSRHESLIAFSNHHYYENRLFTFPAADRSGAVGVQLRLVDGVYGRSKSNDNRKEAEALVDELVARLRDPIASGSSYGVVTFSQAQQTLVEDLLEQQRVLYPEIERHFTSDGEAVFVKNLENVQGDERDVMLFSICYGPDAAGKVHMQFGPLNLKGGERRLNVAITRARSQLLVFSSLRAEQIALQRTQSLGVRHLRAFLDYAARGDRALVEAVQGELGAPESPFEHGVMEALRARGHDVHCQIGCSGYRIDLAIVDPRTKGRYLLGVECDGASYHSAATARDRDRLRQSVLERLGWRMFRIWSTDWWLDGEGELRRFDAAIAAALREPVPVTATVVVAPRATTVAHNDVATAAVNESAVLAERQAEPLPEVERAARAAPLLPSYIAATLAPMGDADAFYDPRSTPVIRDQMAHVLAVEAPICLPLLARRIAEAWNLGRVTARTHDRLRAAFGNAVTEAEGALWPSGVDLATFTTFRSSPAGAAAREADELPAVELRTAMAWVLQQHGSLDEADLLRETARLFGFARLGNAVKTVMVAGLRDLEHHALVRREGSSIRPA